MRSEGRWAQKQLSPRSAAPRRYVGRKWPDSIQAQTGPRPRKSRSISCVRGSRSSGRCWNESVSDERAKIRTGSSSAAALFGLTATAQPDEYAGVGRTLDVASDPAQIALYFPGSILGGRRRWISIIITKFWLAPVTVVSLAEVTGRQQQ